MPLLITSPGSATTTARPGRNHADAVAESPDERRHRESMDEWKAKAAEAKSRAEAVQGALLDSFTDHQPPAEEGPTP